MNVCLSVKFKKIESVELSFCFVNCQNKMSNRDQQVKQAMNEANIAIQYDNNKQYLEAIPQYFS